MIQKNKKIGLFLKKIVLSRIYILHRKQIIQILIGVEIVDVNNLSTSTRNNIYTA